jgi:N6-adenosine-specific RNA methylase IME4
MGRKPIGKKAMTNAQRQRRRRQRIKHADKIERRTVRERAMAEATRTAAATLVRMAPLYGVLYADPPWRFEPRSRISGMDRAADNHYGTMTVEEIAALKVPAAKNCILYLWATAPMLDVAIDVLRAWGFTYCTHLVWAKDRIGTGYRVRSKHEVLLIGTRGEVPAPVPGSQPVSVIAAPVSRHSEKPAIFAERIEREFPNVPKLELFARRPRTGWDVWGDEAALTSRGTVPP